MDNVKIEDLVDSDIEFIEKDSGMSSLGGSKDETPERRAEGGGAEETEDKPTTSSTSPAAAAANAAPAEAEAAATVAPVEEIKPAVSGAATSTTVAATSSNTVAKTDATECYDDEPDETLGERLLGLTEMFPESVRNLTGSLVAHTNSTISTLYKLSCNASWVFFTSSIILFAPVIFETERAQMEEMQKTQQKQVLLGPGSAMIAGGPPAAPAMPSMR